MRHVLPGRHRGDAVEGKVHRGDLLKDLGLFSFSISFFFSGSFFFLFSRLPLLLFDSFSLAPPSPEGSPCARRSPRLPCPSTWPRTGRKLRLIVGGGCLRSSCTKKEKSNNKERKTYFVIFSLTFFPHFFSFLSSLHSLLLLLLLLCQQPRVVVRLPERVPPPVDEQPPLAPGEVDDAKGRGVPRRRRRRRIGSSSISSGVS